MRVSSPDHRRETRLTRRAGPALGILLLLAAGAASAAQVQVQTNGSLVDLEAKAAPLSEVLDRLARLTGMKVVFDGATPRPLVTISVHGRTPTQTVLALLEGTGINYALISDENGVGVRELMLTGATALASSAARAPSPPLRGNRNMPTAPPEPIEEPFADEPPPDEPPTPGNDPGMNPAPDEPMPSGPTNPAAVPTPPPYTPSPFLPTAPNTIQPLQPFPAPTPTAPPQGP
jgi:hypothetical protein